MTNYGNLPENINDNLSEQMVREALGMSLGDYAASTADKTQIDYRAQRIQQLEAHLAELQTEIHKPFEETEEFREFVVWLCGYTARKTPPDQEEWGQLRDHAKAIAAKFALATRERRQHTGPYPEAIYDSGVLGNQVLTGNEEFITVDTSADIGTAGRISLDMLKRSL